MSSSSVSLERLPPFALASRRRWLLWRAGEALLVAGLVAMSFALLPDDRAVVAALTASALVVLSAADIRRRVIPNRIVMPACAIVLLAQIILFPGQAFSNALIALVAAVVLMLPTLAGRSWLGMGDVKLVLLIGLALGWGLVGALMLAFVCVLPAAVIVIIRGGLAARKTMIPFGPFLSLGALIVLFGPTLAGLSG